MTRRALHFVLKIGNRDKNIAFFKNILGMKVLRHEEFENQCKASCNGPYDGIWSKTMIGFGNEDQNFVIELTYNYGISSYSLGNDLNGITIESKNVFKNIKTNNYPIIVENQLTTILSPDGYKFIIIEPKVDEIADKVNKVSLSSSNLVNSVEFWHKFLEMNIFERNENSVIVGYDESECKLELIDIKQKVNHEKAFGRIAFSCAENELITIESKMKKENKIILTPLVTLETPGKASVQVIILSDPDGHEICFVGDQGFRQLSKIDSKADQLLEEAMTKDKSDEWFKKKGVSKQKI